MSNSELDEEIQELRDRVDELEMQIGAVDDHRACIDQLYRLLEKDHEDIMDIERRIYDDAKEKPS